jgi:hypothetical protein
MGVGSGCPQCHRSSIPAHVDAVTQPQAAEHHIAQGTIASAWRLCACLVYAHHVGLQPHAMHRRGSAGGCAAAHQSHCIWCLFAYRKHAVACKAMLSERSKLAKLREAHWHTAPAWPSRQQKGWPRDPSVQHAVRCSQTAHALLCISGQLFTFFDAPDGLGRAENRLLARK